MLLDQLNGAISSRCSAAAAASINIPLSRSHLLREGDIGCRPTSVTGLWTVYL
jgi:hypothetical protein